MLTTRQDAVKACLQLQGAYEDYPFEDPNWTIMRHRGNRKMFAAIYARQGHIWLNLKAEPMWGDLWKSTWPARGWTKKASLRRWRPAGNTAI